MQRARRLAALAVRGARAYRNPVELEPYNRARNVMPLLHYTPDVAVDAWVAPNATVVGEVSVSNRASVWFGAVVRGDLARVTIGALSSIGDRAIVSTARSVPTGLSAETVIGRHVTIGAGSLLRSVTVEDEAVVGLRCVLLEGSVVESGAVLADGTLVPPGRRIPAKQVWAGVPAQYVRDVTYDERYEVLDLAEAVSASASEHKEQLLPYVDEALYREAAAVRERIAALVAAAPAAPVAAPAAA